MPIGQNPRSGLNKPHRKFYDLTGQSRKILKREAFFDLLVELQKTCEWFNSDPKHSRVTPWRKSTDTFQVHLDLFGCYVLKTFFYIQEFGTLNFTDELYSKVELISGNRMCPGNGSDV